MATQLRLCENEHCSDIQDDDYTEKCTLCDGYYDPCPMDDYIWIDKNDEKECCSLCGAGYKMANNGLIRMKGTGNVVCGGANGCDEDDENPFPTLSQILALRQTAETEEEEEEEEDDEDEDEEDEEDEDELWNANLMKGNQNSLLMKEAMKLYPNNREACICHISARSFGTFNGLVDWGWGGEVDNSLNLNEKEDSDMDIE